MIDERLKSLVKYVDKKDNIIDVGCDPALLDIYLVQNNITNSVIVSDISNNALQQGINNIKKYNLDDRIDVRCGNGLEVLNNEDDINTIIISGMGTNTILDILNNNYLSKVNKLIIQSNKDYYLLRSEVTKLGFIISNEEVIVVNNKLYINIIFVRGNKKYSLNELKYGTKDMLNKEIYYKYLINKYNKILNCINDSSFKDELRNEILLIESYK